MADGIRGGRENDIFSSSLFHLLKNEIKKSLPPLFLA